MFGNGRLEVRIIQQFSKPFPPDLPKHHPTEHPKFKLNLFILFNKVMCEFVKCTVHIFHVSVWSSQHHKNLLFENIYIQIFLTMVEGLQWMLWLSRMMMAGVLGRWLLRDALTQGWSDCTLWLFKEIPGLLWWWVAAEASDSFKQRGLILGSCVAPT